VQVEGCVFQSGADLCYSTRGGKRHVFIIIIIYLNLGVVNLFDIPC